MVAIGVVFKLVVLAVEEVVVVEEGEEVATCITVDSNRSIVCLEV